MKKINLVDSNNRKVHVFLIRFFKFNNDKYLIYTLNEKDEQNYVKLYLVKVMEEFGRCLSYHISDDDEWRYTQSILKTILKEIKYNQEKTFEDLEYNAIDGMKIQKARIFKFDERLVKLLTDKVDSNGIEEKENINLQAFKKNINDLERNDSNVITDYKKKCEEKEQEIERLNQIMGELLAENVMYKNKYGELDNSFK